MEVKSRHHLRSDEVTEIKQTLSSGLGVDLDADSFELVEFKDSEFELILVDGNATVGRLDGTPFLTVRGANDYPPERNVVTVDAGAVSFVSDGADVMRPGIVEADDSIEEGDVVAIAEETHGKVLAIGKALTNGADMVGDAGKVVKSIHFVGDELFNFTA